MLRLFIGRELRLVLAGIVVGAVAALILTRTLSTLTHLLYGIGSSDPLTFAAVSLVLITIAALACYIPRAVQLRSIPWWRCATSEGIRQDEWRITLRDKKRAKEMTRIVRLPLQHSF